MAKILSTIKNPYVYMSIFAVLVSSVIGIFSEKAAIVTAFVVFFLFVAFSAIFINRLIAVYLLIWLIPFQNIILMLLSYVFDISITATGAMVLWKEVFIAMILTHIMLVKNKPGQLKLNYVDVFFLLYLFWTTLYLFAFNTVLHTTVEKMYQLQSYRPTVVIVFLYFIGRLINYDELTLKKFVASVIFVACLSALFGLIERSILDADSWRVLGKNLWMTRITYDVSFIEGLPINFYTYLGNIRLRRLISTYGDPLAFGFANIFVITLLFQMIANKFVNRKIVIFNFFKYFALGIIGAALLFSITRAAILGSIIGVTISIMLFSKKRNLILFAVFLLTLFVIVISTTAGYALVFKTINLSDPSTMGHLAAYAIGIKNIIAHPMGLGLGYGGYVASAAGFKEYGANESLFMTILIEKGIIGLSIFVLFVASLLVYCRKGLSILKNRPTSQLVVATVFSSTVPYFMASATTEHWQGFLSAGVYWLFAGMAVNEIMKARKDYSKAGFNI